MPELSRGQEKGGGEAIFEPNKFFIKYKATKTLRFWALLLVNVCMTPKSE
jgi:hypothetical protein